MDFERLNLSPSSPHPMDRKIDHRRHWPIFLASHKGSIVATCSEGGPAESLDKLGRRVISLQDFLPSLPYFNAESSLLITSETFPERTCLVLHLGPFYVADVSCTGIGQPDDHSESWSVISFREVGFFHTCGTNQNGEMVLCIYDGKTAQRSLNSHSG